MHYRTADDAYFEVVEAEMVTLFTQPSTTAFPETYRAFFGFCAKTNSLKLALFDMIESNNPYAFKALFRCLCEHYLKFLYIFVRFVKEKNDTAGSDYFSFCGAMEAHEYVGAIQMAEGLLGNELVGSIDTAIAQLYPRAVGLSRKALEVESSKFKYRTVLRFLQKEAPSMIAIERPFLTKIVPEYALLSSFVHGGPYTDMELPTYSDPEALAKCEQYAEVAFLMAASVFLLSATAISREHPQHTGIGKRVKAVLDSFTQG